MARMKPHPNPVPTPPATPIESIGCLPASQLEQILQADNHPEPRRLWLAVAALHPTLITAVYHSVLRTAFGAANVGWCVDALLELIEMVPAASSQGLAVWRQTWPADRNSWPAWIEVLMGIGRRYAPWNADLILSIVRKLTMLEQEAFREREEEEDEVPNYDLLDSCLVACITQVSPCDLEPILTAFEQCTLPLGIHSRCTQWLVWPLITKQRGCMDRFMGFLVRLVWTESPLSVTALAYLRHLPISDDALREAALSCLASLLEAKVREKSAILHAILVLLPHCVDPMPFIKRIQPLATSSMIRTIPADRLSTYLGWCQERGVTGLPPQTPTAKKVKPVVDFNPWTISPHLVKLTHLIK